MLGRYIRNDFQPYKAEFVIPTPDDYFIWWLFKHKCVSCKKPATEINEIIPRSRSKKSILDWHNRVTLCQTCHAEFHRTGVTPEKIEKMRLSRTNFLISMGREQYL